MMLNKILMTVALVIVSAVGCAGEKNITLVYSGNLDGELEPCGCSAEGDLGGILRHATILKQLRETTPDLIALSTGGMLASMAAQDRLTGEYILKGFAQLNYDGVGMQWSDLAYGDGFIRDVKLPWVATNRLNQDFAVTKEIKRNGVKLAFFSWLDPT
ncbi:MAG: hypothetical protein U1B30_07665, partial [Pseudomonadota bacterium]|nr:hypothetical protein [Pseudomonadota bacterium]